MHPRRYSAGQRLARALDFGEFCLHYQPVVDLRNDRIVGVEALCRWPQSENVIGLPDAFIPQAEASGVIIALGEWVFRTATEQVHRWETQSGIRLDLAVNLSSRQFLHLQLVAAIEDALRQASLAPERLEFEITESVAMHNAEDSVGIMRQLKQLGISLALDDFGTGYSSLSYLKRFPIDKIKIDKSFVHDIPNDANDLAIVTAIIAMAHALGLQVQAEGVETKAQADFLRDCGCELAQGFLYGRALPATDFAEAFDPNLGVMRSLSA